MDGMNENLSEYDNVVLNNMNSDGTGIIEKEAKKVKSSSGEVEFLISRKSLDNKLAEEILFMEIEKGKQSVRGGKTHTREDFQRKYGLIK